MDIEQFKSQWQSLNIKVDRLSEANRELTQKLASQRVVSLKQKLAKKYKRIAFIGIILPFLAPLLYIIGLSLWLCIVYGLFGILAAFINYRFANFILKNDFMSKPIAEAIKHAVKIKEMQRRLLFYSSCAGIVIVALLFVQFYEVDPTLIIPGIIGGVIGLIYDIFFTIKSFRLSKRILKELEDATNDADNL